jgi:KDO2-lipid IV(A) lauroyltransferase
MYYLLYGFLYLFSLLPFWILYGISNFAYVLLYYVIGYRKDIVLSNLAIAFPEKSLEERKRIAKEFYRNFTDNFIEIVKLLSISKRELKKRYTGEFDMPNSYYESGRNIQYHLGHFFNWEYANLALSLCSKFPVLVVYMPIANKAMDKIFNKMRTKFGAKLISATSYLKEFKPYSRQRFSLIFVGDQSAGNTEAAYWLPFFGKLTPFVTGPEKSAKLSNNIVLYAKFSRVKRGHYHVRFFEITSEPKKLPEGEITKQTIQFLEENIRDQPEDYLWTHRRWKHTFDPSKHRAL